MKPNFIPLLFGVTLLAGCEASDSSPLFFGQTIDLGIVVGTSPTGTTPQITVGLKQQDTAIVPTVVPLDERLPGDDRITHDRQIIRSSGKTVGDQFPNDDSMSVFGSFSNKTTVNGVTIGVFFATGLAAQNLSDGFSEAAKTPTETPVATTGTTTTP